VGITRAQEKLHITHAWSRSLFGTTQYNPPSRFVDDIPPELVVAAGAPRTYGRASQRDDWGDRAYRGRRWASDDDPDRHAHRERVVDAALAAGRRAELQPSNAQDKGLKVGDDVRHPKYGEGVIISLRGSGESTEATIRFPQAGTKTFVLAWTPLERV
jgi:DNA helicase-2/ATP-dependent DNA helicase PcrA